MSDGVFDNLTVNLLSILKGNVGIGMLAPNNKLEISGGAFSFYNPGNWVAVGMDYDATGDGGLGQFRFRSNNGATNLNQTNMVINRVNGNVGIGTTDPKVNLHTWGWIRSQYDPGNDNTPNLGSAIELVNRGEDRGDGSGYKDHTWRIYTAAIGGGWGVNPNSFEIWEYPSKFEAPGTGSRPRLRILKSQYNAIPEEVVIDKLGNVGIGNPAPNNKLEISGGAFSFYNPRHWVAVGMDYDATGDGGLGQFRFRSNNNDTNLNQTNMVINRVNGNVGIGTGDPTEKLEVNGNIKVSGGGDVQLVGGDCAEEFDIAGAESVEPGTVMVIDRDEALRPSDHAYDKRVAGVISGAGDLRPGITLDKQNERANRLPLALVGKAYCKVDAELSSIELGDLLTTSSTIGHAMRASDPFKAFGSVIGKALRPMETGRGIIPILIALQ